METSLLHPDTFFLQPNLECNKRRKAEMGIVESAGSLLGLEVKGRRVDPAAVQGTAVDRRGNQRGTARTFRAKGKLLGHACH